MDDKRYQIFAEENINIDEDEHLVEPVTESKLFKKMIIRYGNYIDPFTNERDIVFDKALAEEIKSNFDSKVLQHVPVPIDHTRDPSANVGEVTELEVADDGLYAVLDIRDWEAFDKIKQDLIFDVSVRINWNYKDTETGESKGVVLEHVALVNDPYIEKMTGFEQILANEEAELTEASKKRKSLLRGFAKTISGQNDNNSVMMLSRKANHGGKENFAMNEVEITNNREFPVEVKYIRDELEVIETIEAGATFEVPEDQAESVRKQIEDAVEKPATPPQENTDELSKDEKNEDAKTEDKTEDDSKKEGKVELSRAEYTELSRIREENATLRAEQEYDKLVSEGYITPSAKEDYLELSKFASLEIDKKNFSKEEGETVNLMDKVNSIIRSSGKKVDFSQNGTLTADSKDNTGGLSKELLKGLEAEGIDRERAIELAKTNAQFRETIKKIDEE